MKKYILFFLLILSLGSCIEEMNSSFSLPKCVDQKLDDFKTKEESVSLSYYVLHGDSTFLFKSYYDNVIGNYYIGVNSECDTICFTCGECPTVNCDIGFEDKDWIEVWKM